MWPKFNKHITSSSSSVPSTVQYSTRPGTIPGTGMVWYLVAVGE